MLNGRTRAIDKRSDISPAISRQSAWWFVGGATIVSAFGLVSNRWTIGRLDDTAASDLRGVLAGLSAVGVLALGLQLVLVGILTDPLDRDHMRRPPSYGVTIACGVVCAVGAGAGAALLIESTALYSIQVGTTVAVAIFCAVVTVPVRAVLLGLERWRDIAVIGVIAALPRLVIGLAPGDPPGLFAVLASIALGELIGAGLAFSLTSGTDRFGHWPPSARRHLWNGVFASAGLALVLVMASIARRGQLGGSAGDFSQASNVARVVFLLVFTVAFVFFPRMARHPIGSAELRRAFHTALLLTSLAAVGSATAIASFPETFVRILTDDPIGSATAVRVLAIAFAASGLASVSLMQYIAHGSRFAMVAWPAVVLMVLGQMAATTPDSLAYWALGASLLLLVTSSLPALIRVQPVLRPRQVDHAASVPTQITSGTTIVVPSYNPGAVVTRTVSEIVSEFEAAELEIHVIVVSDGSTDGSDLLLDELDVPQVTHVRHDVNRGKGAALRTGFAAAHTPIVGFVDADGDLAPSQLVKMVHIHHETGADIVFGSKRHSMSTVAVPWPRRFSSRTYQLLIRLLFQLDIADTQTGIKIYRHETLEAALPVVHETGFAFDLELFVAARCSGYSQFVEVPVTVTRQAGSTISSRSALRMIVHTLRIFWRAKVTLQYLRATAVSQTPAHEPADDPGRAISR